MTRIVSLIPSGTEMVCALGYGPNLVGRSHECDYPATVSHLPVLTEPKFNPQGSSFELDRQVKSILQNALSVYRVDVNRLRALKPDIIVTQAQCEVCAVSLADIEEALANWMDGPRPAVFSLSATTMDEVFADISGLAAALGNPNAGLSVISELRGRIDAVTSRAASLSTCPTVASIEWIDPLMAAGNWMPQLIEWAGARNLFGRTGEHSPRLEYHQLVESNPDIVLVAPCGFNIKKSSEEISTLAGDPRWKNLKAVSTGKVFLADGNQYFNRPGPRLVDSLEILAEIAHPEAFSFGYEGRGWKRWQ